MWNFDLSMLGDDTLFQTLAIKIYDVIQKDGLNFVPQYFLNYTRYVNDLHNI